MHMKTILPLLKSFFRCFSYTSMLLLLNVFTAWSTPSTPPSGLMYTPNSVTTVINNAFSANPSVSGSVENYSISPELPEGVTINSITGVISGTPTVTSASTKYTVTASNSVGSTTAVFELTVNSQTSDYRTIYVTGTVSQVQDMLNEWSGALRIGDSFTASFSYDKNVVDNNSAADVGDYDQIDPNCRIVFEINNMVFKSKVQQNNNYVEIVNRPNNDVVLFRTYSCETPYNDYAIEWQLNDNTGTALESDAIPEKIDLSKYSGTIGLYSMFFYVSCSITTSSQSGDGITTELKPAEENQSKVYISGNKLIISNVKGQSDICIYDLKGNLLIAEEYSDNSINIGNLTKGIYIVRYTSADGSLVASKIMR